MKKNKVERVVFQFHIDIEKPSNIESFMKEFRDLVIDKNDNYELIESHSNIEGRTQFALPLKTVRAKDWDKWMWLLKEKEIK